MSETTSKQRKSYSDDDLGSGFGSTHLQVGERVGREAALGAPERGHLVAPRNVLLEQLGLPRGAARQEDTGETASKLLAESVQQRRTAA